MLAAKCEEMRTVCRSFGSLKSLHNYYYYCHFIAIAVAVATLIGNYSCSIGRSNVNNHDDLNDHANTTGRCSAFMGEGTCRYG